MFREYVLQQYSISSICCLSTPPTQQLISPCFALHPSGIWVMNLQHYKLLRWTFHNPQNLKYSIGSNIYIISILWTQFDWLQHHLKVHLRSLMLRCPQYVTVSLSFCWSKINWRNQTNLSSNQFPVEWEHKGRVIALLGEEEAARWNWFRIC